MEENFEKNWWFVEWIAEEVEIISDFFIESFGEVEMKWEWQRRVLGLARRRNGFFIGTGGGGGGGGGGYENSRKFWNISRMFVKNGGRLKKMFSILG